MISMLVTAGFALVAPAYGQLECITQIELPSYSFVARMSLGGDVTAFVRVGPRGKVASIRMPGADQSLDREVEATLREDTLYDSHCSGRQIEVVFTFRLEGDFVDDPHTRIEFAPPNHFILISQPHRPFFDPIR